VEGLVVLAGWLAALEVIEPGKTLVTIRQVSVNLVAEAGGLVEMVAGEAGTWVAAGKGAAVGKGAAAGKTAAAASFQVELPDCVGTVPQLAHGVLLEH
jgi:hypothetical protein